MPGITSITWSAARLKAASPVVFSLSPDARWAMPAVGPRFARTARVGRVGNPAAIEPEPFPFGLLTRADGWPLRCERLRLDELDDERDRERARDAVRPL